MRKEAAVPSAAPAAVDVEGHAGAPLGCQPCRQQQVLEDTYDDVDEDEEEILYTTTGKRNIIHQRSSPTQKQTRIMSRSPPDLQPTTTTPAFARARKSG